MTVVQSNSHDRTSIKQKQSNTILHNINTNPVLSSTNTSNKSSNDFKDVVLKPLDNLQAEAYEGIPNKINVEKEIKKKELKEEPEKELNLTAETCRLTDEEKLQFFSDPSNLTGEDLVNHYVELIAECKDKEEQLKLHAKAYERFDGNQDEIEYYEYQLGQIGLFFDMPQKEADRINNVVEDFKKQCREEHIKSAMEEIVDHNKEVAYYQKNQKKGGVPECMKGIVEMYTVDDIAEEWLSRSQEFSDAINIIDGWELYSEIKEDLPKITELANKIKERNDEKSVKEVNEIRLIYARKRNKLKQRHDDMLFGEMFYEFRESIKLAYSVKQKWFLYYKFKEKVEAIQWMSEEAKRYAKCDLHNFEEEHFSIWKEKQIGRY